MWPLVYQTAFVTKCDILITSMWPRIHTQSQKKYDCFTKSRTQMISILIVCCIYHYSLSICYLSFALIFLESFRNYCTFAAGVYFLIPHDGYRYGANKEVVAMILPKRASSRNGRQPTFEFHPFQVPTVSQKHQSCRPSNTQYFWNGSISWAFNILARESNCFQMLVFKYKQSIQQQNKSDSWTQELPFKMFLVSSIKKHI